MPDGTPNGSTAWRWVFTILIGANIAVTGWLVGEQGKLRDIVYAQSDQSTRQILDERTNTWVPVIVDNSKDLRALERQMNELHAQAMENKRNIERMERSR